MGIGKSPVLYGDCMKPGCIGKSNTNNLPAPTDLTENAKGKKKLAFKDTTQKSAPLVPRGISIELVPTEPIFEKFSHLREKGGGADAQNTHGVCADPYSRYGCTMIVMCYSVSTDV
jgi:hypothetical protein